jgi:hypothetical protein
MEPTSSDRFHDLATAIIAAREPCAGLPVDLLVAGLREIAVVGVLRLRIPFVAIGVSDRDDLAKRAEEILYDEWWQDLDRRR